MNFTPDFRIVRADPIGEGVFIEFADGKSALFPGSFLRAHYPWFNVGPVDEEEERQASDS